MAGLTYAMDNLRSLAGMQVAGFLLLIFAIRQFLNHRSLMRRAVFTKGVVVGVDINDVPGEGRFLHPSIEYRDANGQIVTFTSKHGGTFVPWPIGAQVEVVLGPSEKARAEIHAPDRTAYFHLLMAAMALVLIAAPVLFNSN